MKKKQNSDILIYQTEDGQTKVQVRLQDETAWLSLNQMAELFQRDKSVISRHIRNIFKEGELSRDGVIAKYATTAADGKSYQVEFFNLKLSGLDILDHAGSISNLEALEKAHVEYEKYRAKHLNDPSPVEKHFLKAIKEVKNIEGKKE